MEGVLQSYLLVRDALFFYIDSNKYLAYS